MSVDRRRPLHADLEDATQSPSVYWYVRSLASPREARPQGEVTWRRNLRTCGGCGILLAENGRHLADGMTPVCSIHVKERMNTSNIIEAHLSSASSSPRRSNMAKKPRHIWVLWWPFLGVYVTHGSSGGIRIFDTRIAARTYSRHHAPGSIVVKLEPK